jgi:hypothetical protein
MIRSIQAFRCMSNDSLNGDQIPNTEDVDDQSFVQTIRHCKHRLRLIICQQETYIPVNGEG